MLARLSRVEIPTYGKLLLLLVAFLELLIYIFLMTEYPDNSQAASMLLLLSVSSVLSLSVCILSMLPNFFRFHGRIYMLVLVMSVLVRAASLAWMVAVNLSSVKAELVMSESSFMYLTRTGLMMLFVLFVLAYEKINL